ncbi:MAG: NAD(P)-binding domain-containing protein, partial [bacterium]|nr:NAD(P)-binding domain-containing protein [bacterium]
MKKIGYIGLGKMGMGQVERLLERGYEVFAWNRSEKPREKAARAGARIFESYEKLCKGLLAPRTIWLMLPSSVVDEALAEISPHLEKGDTVIDGGNSFYKDSMRRAYELAARGVHFLDVGTSGGPSGARNGACLMIGGDREVFQKHEKLFKDLATSYSPFSKGSGRRPRDFEILRLADSPPPLRKEESIQYSYAYVGKAGAGHFVKMVHNGIEYGMMQAIGEGFNLLR